MQTTHTTSIRQALTALALACASISQAMAAPVVFSDRASFTTAVSSLSQIDFGSTSGFTGLSSYTSGNVSFSNPSSGYLYIAGANYAPYQWNSGSSLLFGSTNEGGRLVIQLSGGVHSFGFDFMAEADSAPDATAGINFGIDVDGSSYTGTTLQRPNRAFFGISSDAVLTTVTLTMSNPLSFRALPIIDNVSYSLLPAANDVAEPASLALAGVALLALGAARRRLR